MRTQFFFAARPAAAGTHRSTQTAKQQSHSTHLKAIGPASLYTKCVSIKLSVANRYLRNPEVQEKTVIRSVATSSAIEGIRAPFARGAQTGASSKVRLKRKKS
jgi:hypothetical protein